MARQLAPLAFSLILVASVALTLGSAGASRDKQKRARASAAVSKAIPRLEPEARRRWPGSFAGLWMERGGPTSKTRKFGLHPMSLSLRAGERRTVPLAFEDDNAVKKLQRLLKRRAYHRGSRAKIAVRATDAAGNSTTRHLEVKLDRKRARRSVSAARAEAAAAIQLGQVSPDDPPDCGGTPNNVQAETGPSPSYEAPVDGTITRWSHTGDPDGAGSGRLQVWRRAEGTNYTLVGRSSLKTFTPGANSYATSIPVKKGDLLGLQSDAEAGCMFGAEVGDLVRNDGPDASEAPLGATRDMFGEEPELRVNVSATLEPEETPEVEPDERLALDVDAAQRQGVRDLQFTVSCPEEACEVEIGGEAVARRQKPGRRVFVAFTEKAKQRVRRLRRGFPKPGMVRPVRFEHSVRELEGLQAEMIADRESFRKTGPPFPGVSDELYDLDIDVTRNAPVVILEHPTDAAAAAIRARYGPDVIVEAGVPAEPHACNSRDDCPDLRSGLRTLTNGRGACSTAFTSYLGRSAKNLGVLSAAHCGGPNSTYPNSDLGSARLHGTKPAQYGTVYKEKLFGEVDAEWHYVSREPFKSLKPAPRIYLKDAYKSIPVKGVGKWAQLVVGPLAICKSGITTGYTCGVVKSKSFSPSYVPWSHDFVKSTYCSQKGDSGAGVYVARAYTAIGVHSGGAKDTPCNDPKHYSIFGHIQFVQSQLGVHVAVAATP